MIATEEASDHPRPEVIRHRVAPGHRRRSMLGNSCQTFTPQKCEPSVQIGEATPARM